MNRYLSVARAQITFSIGRFVLLNPKDPIRKFMVKTVLWLIKKRMGKDALDFLESESTKDDSF